MMYLWISNVVVNITMIIAGTPTNAETPKCMQSRPNKTTSRWWNKYTVYEVSERKRVVLDALFMNLWKRLTCRRHIQY